MKRKLLVVLAAFMFLFGVAGQAMAFFEDTELIRVVYQVNGPNEMATDLGFSLNDVTSPLTSTVVLNSNNFSLFGTSQDWGDYRVAYFARDLNGAIAQMNAYVSGPLTGQTSGAGKGATISNAINSISIKYRNLGEAQSTLAKTDPASYFKLLDLGSAVSAGSFAAFIPGKNGEVSLAALATVGYVDQFLYFYDTPNVTAAGVAIAKIRTFADGHTELSAVPVPAALYLLGSGLLGLIGIRRRLSA